MEGIKHDTEKPPVALLSTYALLETAKVLGYGAEKYTVDNWRGGIAWRRLTGAAMRHILAFNDGEDNDSESGLCHLAHAMCMVMFALESTVTHPELDDRWKSRPIQTREKFDYTAWAERDKPETTPAVGTRVEVIGTYRNGPSIGTLGTLESVSCFGTYPYKVQFDAAFPAWWFHQLDGETDGITIRRVKAA